ncbi:hypothetical protein ACFX2I_022531 [Malus domestica]|uniref:Uncharacterized protein n=1 Tax=Malus domestica TaxID=3750 RepID=A0A498HQQ3_MALDO|nr:hypothetical protein DVH24_018836 [Malus domestica]
MEAYKERREQLMEEEKKRGGGRKEEYTITDDESVASKNMRVGFDPVAKAIIQECIISHDGGNRGGAKGPDDVLAFSRSDHKTDSSLE